MIVGYDNWKLATPDYLEYDEAPAYCAICGTEYYESDESCNCYCQECGEELPEVDDAHCQECCRCDACLIAEEQYYAHHDATGEWLDSYPIVTGKKVYNK